VEIVMRSALLLLALPLAGCAGTPTRALVADDTLDGYVVMTSATTSSSFTAPAPAASAPALPAPAALEPSAAPAASALPEPIALAQPALADESLHASRFTIKGGYYGSEEDALDDGWIVNLSWMRFFTGLFALEFEVGYLDADGEDGGVDTDLWAVPLMVNGRLNLPLWILDVYGGLGVGGFYYDIEASGGGADDDDDGFLLGGNVFLGATVNLADAVALGLEGKYYVTDEISDFDESLDAFALMLTLGFSR
jgi:hypothetical protein